MCILPSSPRGSVPARSGRWICARPAGFESVSDESASIASKELQEHQVYVAFKKSSRKKYERQFVSREFVLSDVAREETPREEGKCLACGYFACQCRK